MKGTQKTPLLALRAQTLYTLCLVADVILHAVVGF